MEGAVEVGVHHYDQPLKASRSVCGWKTTYAAILACPKGESHIASTAGGAELLCQ